LVLTKIDVTLIYQKKIKLFGVYKHTKFMIFLYINILLIFLLSSCQPPIMDSSLGKSGCRRCHRVELDSAHDIGCQSCHQGNPEGYTLAQAHNDLISMPSHPQYMDSTCGRCHAREVSAARSSTHFTLSGMVGAVWSGFFPGDHVPTLLELPIEEPPYTERGLVSDMLRRRCLRCHVYYRGDDYRGTVHGTGCGACHLSIKAEGPGNHQFSRKVPDIRCLSCHYGNFVGWDYYGRFDKDYQSEYSMSPAKGERAQRPYGVKWHEMTQDVHKRADMKCIDCHYSGPCQGKRPHINCTHCHLGDRAEFYSGPSMDPKIIGHRSKDIDLVDCAACHCLWSVQDQGRSLIRQDFPDYEDWSYLVIQGSSEVESIIRSQIDLPYEDWNIPLMMDKLNGEYRPGLWFESFTERRWNLVELGEDDCGRLTVVRPILDLSLTYVDIRGVVRFDNLRPAIINNKNTNDTGLKNVDCKVITPLWLSYSPHTIGMADAFRTIYVQLWLNEKYSKADNSTLPETNY
jgi:hypothetical protein